jgi:HAD superfamily hydrolase (TIGR01509 family)
MPQITQLFFDCDNTLVQSEEIAIEACADLVNTILAAHNIPTRYTSDTLIEQFIGQKFRGMLHSLISIHNLTIPATEIERYVKAEENMVIRHLEAKAKACVGATEVLSQLATDGQYGLAVVSSSAIRRVRVALAKAGQDALIPSEHVFSAQTSLSKPASKPDPAVYLFAMEKLGVKPEQCVAVEDSKAGATSACCANVPTIAYVGAYHGEKKQKEIGELLVKVGCRKVMYNW